MSAHTAAIQEVADSIQQEFAEAGKAATPARVGDRVAIHLDALQALALQFLRDNPSLYGCQGPPTSRAARLNFLVTIAATAVVAAGVTDGKKQG